MRSLSSIRAVDFYGTADAQAPSIIPGGSAVQFRVVRRTPCGPPRRLDELASPRQEIMSFVPVDAVCASS
jgi:hypothetical protein